MKRFSWLLLVMIPMLSYVNFATERVNKNSSSLASPRYCTIYHYYSANKKYVIKCINQHIFLESGSNGQLYVCNTDNDSILYKINMYLNDKCQFDQHFLSDDGKYFSFITYYCSSAINKCNKLLSFENGVLKQEIALDSLLENKKLIEEGDYIFYDNPEIRYDTCRKDKYIQYRCDKNPNQRRDLMYLENIDSLDIFADKFPTFQLNDTIFIFNERRELFFIDVRENKAGKIDYEKNYDYYLSNVKPVFTDKVSKEAVDGFNNFPDKEIIADKIAKYLNLQYDEKEDNSFHYYDVRLEGLLYKDGSFEFVKSNYVKKLPDSNILQIIKEHKFSSDLVPYFTDRWYFNKRFSFRNPNDSLAILELKDYELQKELEYKENAYKDTLDGEYIPKDLYEAMEILDATESEALKERFRTYVDNGDYESYVNRPHTTIDWPLKNNSRIAHYLDSFGITHFESKYHFILNSFTKYLNNDSLFLINRNYKDFVKDSNMFVYYESKYSKIKNEFYSGLKIVKPDSNGKRTLYYPFDKLKFYEYSYNSDESYFENYQDSSYDYESQDFLELLSVYLKDFDYYFDNGCPWDSLLFINDYPDNKHLLFHFSRYLLKGKIGKFMEVDKFQIFHKVGKSELDSLDNLFLNHSISFENLSEYEYAEQITNCTKSIMEDFLSTKPYGDFYVIRFYPDIKFDFKEYKEKRKKQKK